MIVNFFHFNFYLIESSEQGNRDLSKYLAIPTLEEKRKCYEDFYDATSNAALTLRICPVCAREMLEKDGEVTMILSDPSIVEVLSVGSNNSDRERNPTILRDLLEMNEGGVSCWMCFECLGSLKRHALPKFSLANNLFIGDIPSQLTALTIPEQLLIARHYPRCYIFKLFPRDCDLHLPIKQLYMGMAGNATLFEINTQEVVDMLKGQCLPSPVTTLASIIAITFIGSQKLPMDWLKKTFRVRRFVILEALKWLWKNNPIYEDIVIDSSRLEELPIDDIPETLLAIVRQEEDDEIVERERETYVESDMETENVVNHPECEFSFHSFENWTFH